MKKIAFVALCAAASMVCMSETANAATYNFSFTSGTTTSASATDGSFLASITADGTQSFNYPSSFLRSSSGASGDSLTLNFNEAVDALSFDVGSLDTGNAESLVFSYAPSVTALTTADWRIGGPLLLSGNTVSGSGSGSTGRVLFTNLGGITSFTFSEVFSGHAIYYDNFSVSTVAAVPLPAAGWMLIAGLGGLAAARRRRKS